MRYGLDAFTELGFKADSLTLIGGGSNSALWRQMASDICNLPTRVPVVSEAAAFGGALQAMALVENRDLAEICEEHVAFKDDTICNPDADAVDKYREVYASWNALVGFVEPLYK